MKTRFLSIAILLVNLVWNCHCQDLEVVAMPSNSNNKMEGNAVLNEPIEIWGSARGGGTSPYQWKMYVDDDLVGSGTAVDGHFIGKSYSFHTLGKRKFRIEVNGISAESVIRVHYDPIDMIKINMMIEKGLLYLYKNRNIDGQGRVYWLSTSSPSKPGYTFAGTSAAILAFEEFGHLPANDYDKDPYADLVSGGLEWILGSGSGQKDINNHDDGTGNIRVSDLFTDTGGPLTTQTGLLKGAYLFAQDDPNINYDLYANAFGLLAVILSQLDSAQAKNYIIKTGYFERWTLYNFIQDALDLLYWSQGDGDTRGGYRYYLNQNSCCCWSWEGARFDGSAQQWPALVFKATIDRYNIEIPAWVTENAIHGYDVITNSEGGCGYNYNWQYVNCGKTGGMLAAYSWFNKLYNSGNLDALKSVDYMNTNYNNYGGNDYGQNPGAGWAGNYYHMYAVKKGMQLQNISFIGDHDWYKDMVAWLSGQQIGSLPPEFNSFSQFFIPTEGYGQNDDGSWLEETWMDEKPISTAHALLILIQAVTVLPPVAIIAPLPPQPANTPFRLDGSHSFHLDPTSSIIEWNWDFDGDGQFDDGKGQRPNHPGHALGSFQVSLQVVDDNNPPLTNIAKITVTVNGGDHPPIAVPIPDSLLPCYAGRVNESVHIDGRESFDPDNTPISQYSWDTDGDGEIGDLLQPQGNVSFDKKYNGQVGLKVRSNDLFSSQEYADIFISDDDVFISEVKASPVYQGYSKVDIRITLHNDAESSQDFPNMLVRLFDDNPFTNGNRIGTNYYVPLYRGVSVILPITLNIDSDIRKVYAYVDADQRIEEWNEVNNYMPVDIIKFGNDDNLVLCENTDTLVNLFKNDFNDGYSLKLLSVPDQPDHGSAIIVDDSLLVYSPDPGFFSPPVDQFTYNMEIRNNSTGELVGYDTSSVSVTINPKPVIFGEDDTLLVCPLDSCVISAGNPGSTYLWSTGETSQSIVDSTSGVTMEIHQFIVKVTNQFNCDRTDTIMIYFVWEVCIDSSGIQEITRFSEIMGLYPNPSPGVFSVRSISEQPLHYDEISVFDILGRIKYYRFINVVVRQNQLVDIIDLTSLPNGIYLVRVKNEAGYFDQKLILEH